jgi:hypothetical protein
MSVTVKWLSSVRILSIKAISFLRIVVEWLFKNTVLSIEVLFVVVFSVS